MMSAHAQPASHTGNQILVGPPSTPHALDELPLARGEAAILQLLHRGPGRSGVPSKPAHAQAQAKAAAVEPVRSKRVLLTQVFTDIVSSTETLERLGDKAWCSLLLRHQDVVREHLKSFRGREVHAAGDGFFLVFDRPTRAVQFAAAVRASLRSIGVDVRIGIHTGECEVVSGRVEGIAVHTAARVSSSAGAGEILVSSTVRDLVAGSEHRFSKRDLRVLKGLSEPRQLFALEPTADEFRPAAALE